MEPNLLVSDRVQVVMPYHILFGQYEEERLGGAASAPPSPALRPSSPTSMPRSASRSASCSTKQALWKSWAGAEVKNVMLEHLYHKPTLNAREVYDAIKPALEEVRPYVTDTFHFLHKAVLEGKVILLEGQLGPMKDPDHGIYPMVVLLSSGRLRHRGRRSAPYEIKDIVCRVQGLFFRRGRQALSSAIFR